MPTDRPGARILLVDDHALFRDGLARLINDQPDMTVVGQAADGLEAVQLARDLDPDLIVMDINMPISDGLEATRLIRDLDPEAKILMLTVRDEDVILFEAIKAGANGYLLKISDADEFLEGMGQVLAGEAVLPPKLASRVLAEFARLANQPAVPAAPKEEFGLTSRELDVLNLIAEGRTDKEIASALDLSVYTIKSHVRSILSKLHAINRWEAARKAREEGLLSD
ncbi:MAG TPA: response regulator transcription factor [Anaerolineae bacterium]|jgi:DNA-binding NarL/FixJ family response regulator|nr:response regulator transcription factor [Anaerolineae bacterium]